MEIWERAIIRKNLVELHESTRCNTVLLSFLVSNSIISEEDRQQINAKLTEPQQAAALYSLITTRKNAFAVLMEGLSKTRQSGALNILRTERTKHDLDTINNTRPSGILATRYDCPKSCLKLFFTTKKVSGCLIALTCSLFFGLTQNHYSVKYIIETFDVGPAAVKFLIDYSRTTINEPDTNGATLLHKAVYWGRNEETIETLINLGADWKIKDKEERTVFHYAVDGGNQQAFRYFKSIGGDANAVDNLGESPLHLIRFTRHKNYWEMTKFLIQNECDIYSGTKNGSTLAHLISLPESVSKENFQIWARSIIEAGHGKIFSVRNKLGRTPLHNAVWRLDLDKEIISLIITSANISINEEDVYGATVLHQAISHGRSVQFIENILQLGGDWHKKNKRELGVMHYAVIGNNKAAFLYFKSLGADISATDDFDETPLHKIRYMYSEEHLELASFLFENGADLYAKNKLGDTLTHQFAISDYVTSNGFRIWVTNIIKTGHSKIFTIPGQKGRTPIHTAVLRIEVDLDLLNLIINSANLDINKPDDDGNTILLIALNAGRSFQLIKNLLKLGADWRQKCLKNGGVMHHTVIGGNQEAFLFFKSIGADVNQQDIHGETPFHKLRFTKMKDYLEMTSFLLENGANPYAKDYDGNNAAVLFYSGKQIGNKEWQSWKDYMISLGHKSLFVDESTLEKTI